MPVRLARPSDLRHLAGIEAAGIAPFEELFGADLHPVLRTPPASGAERDARPGWLLVATVGADGTGVRRDDPVGFAHVLELTDPATSELHAHLEQLSVHPGHFRRGLGTALVRAAQEEARWTGYGELTLCTYRDVAWNGPFYERLGFVEVAEADQRPFQRELRAHETAVGLDVNGPRIVMSAPLSRRPSTVGGRSEARSR